MLIITTGPNMNDSNNNNNNDNLSTFGVSLLMSVYTCVADGARHHSFILRQPARPLVACAHPEPLRAARDASVSRPASLTDSSRAPRYSARFRSVQLFLLNMACCQQRENISHAGRGPRYADAASPLRRIWSCLLFSSYVSLHRLNSVLSDKGFTCHLSACGY